MSAAAAPPPPPPPGGGPGKDYPGHKTPGKTTIVYTTTTRQRGDGKNTQTAYWIQELWDNPNQKQFVVHRCTNELPNRWVRTTEGEARLDAQTGFSVWELNEQGHRRVDLAKGALQYQPFQAAFREIEQEEQRRVANHEYAGRDEDLLEDMSDEYEEQDPTPFDFPERRSSPRAGLSSTTPRHSRNEQTSSPLNPRTPSGPGSGGSGGRGSANRGSGGHGGRGSGGSRGGRGPGSSPGGRPESPLSPSGGRGHGGSSSN